jgi:hypothetical protein
MRLNGEIYYFNGKNGLYVYELNSTSTILLTTVEEKKRKYKKREVRDTDEITKRCITDQAYQQWFNIKLPCHSSRCATRTGHLGA